MSYRLVSIRRHIAGRLKRFGGVIRKHHQCPGHSSDGGAGSGSRARTVAVAQLGSMPRHPSHARNVINKVFSCRNSLSISADVQFHVYAIPRRVIITLLLHRGNPFSEFTYRV
ncbi:hypothetical protein QE152_g278 [Popillia japonica]|uniref:Uncharacterized protein n=1 Tax=Popillia japonica TaxID=7064 RepID=A0AAW1NK13_POPJA